jgi:hypothetical protein
VVVLAVGAWALSRTLGTKLPLYEGKTLDYWSGELTNRDAAASNRAAAVIASEIIPALTNEVVNDTSDSRLKVLIIDQLNQLPGVQVDFIGAEQRRASAVMDLGSLGPRAQAAKPLLLDLQKDKAQKDLAKVLSKTLRQIDGQMPKPAAAQPAKKSAAAKQPKKSAAADQPKTPAAADQPKTPAAPEPPKPPADNK